MGGLLYDDDLTFLDPSLAAAIRHIHQRASAAVAAIEAADNNVELNAALASLISVKNEAFEKLLDDAIAESDMPFGDVSSNDDATRDYEHDASDDGQSDTASTDSDEDSNAFSSDGEREVGLPLSATGNNDTEHVSNASNPNNHPWLTVDKMTAFADLRRMCSVFYTIHLRRLDRLVLRLPSSRDLSGNGSPAGPMHVQASPESDRPRDIPLPHETAAEYAEIVGDEISLTAEYRMRRGGIVMG